MMMYRASLTEKYTGEAAGGVSIAPVLESSALDEYGGSWSVIIHNEDGDECSFSFLSSDAPRVLREGDGFTLREGERLVAKGVITGVND